MGSQRMSASAALERRDKRKDNRGDKKVGKKEGVRRMGCSHCGYASRHGRLRTLYCVCIAPVPLLNARLSMLKVTNDECADD